MCYWWGERSINDLSSFSLSLSLHQQTLPPSHIHLHSLKRITKINFEGCFYDFLHTEDLNGAYDNGNVNDRIHIDWIVFCSFTYAQLNVMHFTSVRQFFFVRLCLLLVFLLWKTHALRLHLNILCVFICELLFWRLFDTVIQESMHTIIFSFCLFPYNFTLFYVLLFFCCCIWEKPWACLFLFHRILHQLSAHCNFPSLF